MNKAKLFKILDEFPDDYSKAAKELKTTRAQVKAFIDDPANNYQEVKDSYLDSLTSAYKNWVRGVQVIEGFNGAHALKILERDRPEDWEIKKSEDKPKVRPLLPLSGSAPTPPAFPALKSVDFRPTLTLPSYDEQGSGYEITDEDLKNMNIDFNEDDLYIEDI